MENTIVLNSGEKIEVLFCDEVSLDIDCGIRYIASGKQEIEQYVNEVSKPTLDAVILKAQTDMAEQIAQGIEDASSSAAQSAQSTIDNFVSVNKGEIDSYMSTSILPTMDEKLTLVKVYADNTETHAQEATNQSAQATQKAAEASQSAQEAAQSASSAADSAALAIAKSSFGNIGDIKYTTRTDVPNGGAWCDGAEYTQAAFPDIYQMLVDGKISSTDFATFNDSVSTNGSCGLFALDTATTSFKVPLLKDIYIKASDTTLAFGAESLPNITGTLFGGSSGFDPNTGSFEVVTTLIPSGWSNPNPQCYSATFDASRSSPAYQDGAKVNPDNVIYRAYVVLYASAAEASAAQAAEFMTALGGKANLGLDNVDTQGKETAVAWCIPDYSAGITISSLPYIAPADGVVNINITGNVGAEANLSINNVLVYIETGEGSVRGRVNAQLDVKKDDVISSNTPAAAGKNFFFPFKGVNNV